MQGATATRSMVPPLALQSSFGERDQGDISGLSRSVSNLGSSLGTALVGSILVAVSDPAGHPFAAALITMLVFTLIGLGLAVLIPRRPVGAAPAAGSPPPGDARSAGPLQHGRST